MTYTRYFDVCVCVCVCVCMIQTNVHQNSVEGAASTTPSHCVFPPLGYLKAYPFGPRFLLFQRSLFCPVNDTGLGLVGHTALLTPCLFLCTFCSCDWVALKSRSLRIHPPRLCCFAIFPYKPTLARALSLPLVVSTSGRLNADFIRLVYLHATMETKDYLSAIDPVDAVDRHERGRGWGST